MAAMDALFALPLPVISGPPPLISLPLLLPLRLRQHVSPFTINDDHPLVLHHDPPSGRQVLQQHIWAVYAVGYRQAFHGPQRQVTVVHLGPGAMRHDEEVEVERARR